MTLTYTLSGTELTVTYQVHNTSARTLPFGFALHPYFSTFTDTHDVSICIPAQAVMEADDEMLPTGRIFDVSTTWAYYALAKFTYEAEQDQYRGPQGHVLRPAYRMEGTQEIQDRADAAVCNACPVKAQCTESPRGRHVHRSFFADYVERVKGYQQTLSYQKALNKRKVWVEPLFAEGKQWHGMRRFRLRRLWRVNCEALMIACGQNLKRLLQKRGWGRRPFPTEVVALRPAESEEGSALSRNIALKHSRAGVAAASLACEEIGRMYFEAHSSRFSLRNSIFVIFLSFFKHKL